MRRAFFYWRRAVAFAEIVGIIVTLALLPIDRLPYLHHIPFGIGFISLLLLLLATLGRLLDLLRSRQLDKLKHYLLGGCLLGLPVLGYGISTIYAIDRSYAIGATKLLLAVCLRAFCFFVLVSEKPDLWKPIRRTIYIVTAIVVAFAYFQFIADIFGASQRVTDLRSCCTSNSTYVFPRVHSTSIEPLYFANYLLIPIWLLVFDFLKSKRSRVSWPKLVLFVSSISIVILIVARGAILALLIGLLVFALGLRGKKKLKDFYMFLTKTLGAAIILALALVLLSGLASQIIHKKAINGSAAGPAGNVQIFSSHAINPVDDSAKTRYSLWPKSLSYIKQRPLQGVGAYNSRIRLNIGKYNQGVPPDHLQPFNNDLIGLLVDLGLLGVATFGPIIYLVIRGIYRLYKNAWTKTAAPMALVMVGTLIQSNFFHAILLTRTWVVVGLLMTGLGARHKTSEQAKR